MSIHRRPNGRWAVQIYDPVIKRMRQVGTYDTRRHAKAAEGQAVAQQLHHGATVADFCAMWLRDFPRPKPSSRKTLEQRMRSLLDTHGSRRMDSITVLEARRWALAHPYCLSAPRAMWNDARRAGMVVRNPFERLGIEKSPGRRELPSGWLTAQDVQDLQAVALTEAGLADGWAPVFAGAIALAAYTGLRPGELYALRHTDLSVDTIDIRRGADSHTHTIGSPKNSYSRTIVYPAAARAAVAAIPRETGSDLVVYTPRGKQFWAPTFGRYWDRVKCAAGRPNMDFYELRHFCATHLLELGVAAADVAVQLGHRDGGALVMSTYGHPSDELARQRVRAALDSNQTGDLAARKRIKKATS